MTVYFSRHARVVMDERGVTSDEITSVVLNPEVTYRNPRPNHPDQRVHQSGSLAVVCAPLENEGDMLVVTVLWRNTEQWTNDQMKGDR